ncbi:MAG: STAS domain-containing protein [Clostridia bacterium]|nr:STAS domain-containing protein [Clostridia bacterium]MBQ2517624.1 STAS domain-containing protein [Clostridia bacterium]MBQ4342029.1 STAS domain-containing protein [Clostridia bacterium]
MTATLTKNENSAVIRVSGRLDTVTAPEFESVLQTELSGIDTLTLDLAELEYISSAGLRTLLVAKKMMSERKGLSVINANETVREIFDITGFSEVLEIA